MKTICNKCGKELDDVFALNNSINKEFGYGSVYDGQSWQLCLCDDCLNEMVASLKHKPTGYMEDEYKDYYNAMI